jgi:glycosyltransferase involved in cell wall biosynthesis
MPLISVLITTYNREKYIEEAIQSILDSTFEDFEVILVDDCSTDKTVEKINQIRKKDSRIKFYQNKVNQGDYPNRIIAASYASGEYLKYVDADDKIYPWTLDVFVNAVIKFPDAALFISPTSDKITQEFPFVLHPQESLRHHFFKASILDGGPTCTLIKKRVYDEIGGFTVERWISDFKLWLQMASQFDVVILNQGLIFWREHEDQQIKTEKSNEKEFTFLFNSFFKPFIQQTKESLLSKTEKKRIYRMYYKSNIKKSLEKTSKWILKLSTNL